jgi:hypothetical protein
MSQSRLYINYTFTKLLFGISYEKNCCFELWLGFIKIGIGLSETAHGFDCWKI